jgi:HD superfamily phosphohydrolase
MNRDYLSENDVPTQRVRCPVHGFIRYSKNERKLIDHEVFQRLRHIRQLAMEYLVYPGAMHTRFEHSLGVMEMATQMFDTLERQHRVEIQDDLKQVPELREETMPKVRQTRPAVRFAARCRASGIRPRWGKGYSWPGS